MCIRFGQIIRPLPPPYLIRIAHSHPPAAAKSFKCLPPPPPPSRPLTLARLLLSRSPLPPSGADFHPFLVPPLRAFRPRRGTRNWHPHTYCWLYICMRILSSSRAQKFGALQKSREIIATRARARLICSDSTRKGLGTSASTRLLPPYLTPITVPRGVFLSMSCYPYKYTYTNAHGTTIYT